jgi:hypothetical protein
MRNLPFNFNASWNLAQQLQGAKGVINRRDYKSKPMPFSSTYPEYHANEQTRVVLYKGFRYCPDVPGSVKRGSREEDFYIQKFCQH